MDVHSQHCSCTEIRGGGGGGGDRKEERVKQHLEVGGQADDGQVSQLVPLCRGQLWQRGRSLCNGGHTATFSKRESQWEEHTQVASACPLRSGPNRSDINYYFEEL